jgi:uncharacterized protein
VTTDVIKTTILGGKPKMIAAWWHLLGYFAIIAYITIAGFRAQQTGMDGSATPTGQLGRHSEAYRFYLISIGTDWLFFYYCWVGVHWKGGDLATLTGGRWPTWKQLATDVAIAIPFWVIWEATACGVLYLLGPNQARSAADLLPKSAAEVLVWLMVCITAGFTEEIQTRGYLQQQLHAVTGSIVAAVVLQGVAFGVQHSYQGWKHIVVIIALGVLYGALAAWRRNLRANMIAHALSDVWEGWLKLVLFR